MTGRKETPMPLRIITCNPIFVQKVDVGVLVRGLGVSLFFLEGVGWN